MTTIRPGPVTIDGPVAIELSASPGESIGIAIRNLGAPCETGADMSGTDIGVHGTADGYPPGPYAIGVVGEGPGTSGLDTNIGNVGVLGNGSSGVVGIGTSDNGNGVAGFGAGEPYQLPPIPTRSGVYGTGNIGVWGVSSGTPPTIAPSSAVGVYGQAGGSNSPGVVGITAGGDPDTIPSKEVGVYGQTNADTAVVGIGQGGDPNTIPDGVGVYGDAQTVGVAANSNTGVGVSAVGQTGVQAVGAQTGVLGFGVGDGATVGVQGQGQIGVVALSDGQSNSIGFYAEANPLNKIAGEFQGDVFILGNQNVTGVKSAVVPLADGTHRRLYCVESPESWFEDVGFGTLVNGRAEISLDPDFASTVQTDQYHVFITEYDGSNALYVTGRSATGFEVRAGVGAVDASFSYRVMAKRKDIQGARLEAVELPTPRMTELPTPPRTRG